MSRNVFFPSHIRKYYIDSTVARVEKDGKQNEWVTGVQWKLNAIKFERKRNSLKWTRSEQWLSEVRLTFCKWNGIMHVQHLIMSIYCNNKVNLQRKQQKITKKKKFHTQNYNLEQIQNDCMWIRFIYMAWHLFFCFFLPFLLPYLVDFLLFVFRRCLASFIKNVIINFSCFFLFTAYAIL